jgi:type IV secretory pathway TraG/TraD family ATPase VirD4
MATAFDADHLARALIADQAGEDRNWRGYARTLVAATLRRLHRAGVRDVATVQRLLLHAPTNELARLLEGSAAAPFLTEENARFFASVRAIATAHLAILEHLEGPAGGTPLSVRAWIRARQGGANPAVLFLPYRPGQIATLKGTVSAWLRLAIFETLDSGGPDRPIWFVADELDAIGAIDGLKDALARLRKAGGRCVLGFQSIAQVTGTYGSHDAQTIIENCGNTLILRCSSSGRDGTAEFASRLIGEREVFRQQITRSRRGAFEKAQQSRTIAEQLVTERAVLAVELEQLADFTGYLKFASAPEWRRIGLDAR